jgi:Xaa-Pro aminopeptidase
MLSTAFAALLSLPVAGPAAETSAVRSASAADSGVIRAAPPAPVFTDEERRAELASRRARVAEKIGPKALLVLFSAEPRVYTNDVSYEFRQENNLYYLTNLRQQGATLVLAPGSTGPREILFLPRRNATREAWTGHMYSAEEARKVSGVAEIWAAGEFEPFMQAVREKRAYRPQGPGVLLSESAQASAQANPFESLFGAMGKGEAELYLIQAGRNSREFRRETEYAEGLTKEPSGFAVKNAFPIFVELRMRKSPMELRLLQHAVDISIEGHQRAQAVAPRAKWEYEVEAEIDYTNKRRNADNWGYPNIVGCGPNATTLHYEESQGAVKPTDLILIDAGAEYDHYTADVTRTFPAGGRFSPAQAEIYNVVLAGQEAAFRAVKPGSSMNDVNAASLVVVKDGLLKLGLITERDGTIDIGEGRSIPQHFIWTLHFISHYIGMNVHDVGPNSAKLEPGMVFTVEPGVYVRLDALDNLPDTPGARKFKEAVRPAFEKYKGIGVRIEDDVVVTQDGYRNMSAALARTIPEIEAFMRKAQNEIRH